jgi:acetolactate synthase-1/2/3 large subunit
VDLTAQMPDLAAIARGFGALGFTIRTAEELHAALAEALSTGRTAVLDVMVDQAEKCFPMILPGGAAADQVEWPGTSP